jgi:formylmethanofuran dehydrogenase subunit E
MAPFDLMPFREALLDRHSHICPRQILGLRMGALAGRMLGIDLPQCERRMLALVETDGCFADGVSVATGCALGHRTLRLMDHGKVAATFVDLRDDLAHGLRIHPHPDARSRAVEIAPGARSRWHAMLEGYQTMSDDALLRAQRVRLSISIDEVISRAGLRATCAQCGEEIINARERWRDGRTLCRACSGEGYYTAAPLS